MSAPPDARKRLIAALHAEAKARGLDEDTRRDLIERVTGQRSSKDLTIPQLGLVLDALKGSGRGTDDRQQASKLRALWRSLYQLGHVENPSNAALAAYVCRQTGIEALRWNRAADLHRAIDCLGQWCRRVGYEPTRYAGIGPLQGRFEVALIEAQWRRLADLGAFGAAGDFAIIGKRLMVMFGVQAPGFLTPEQAQEVIRNFGAWIRRVKAKGVGLAQGGDPPKKNPFP
jgi:hypothetical protein